MPRNKTEEKKLKINAIKKIAEFPGTRHKMMVRIYPPIHNSPPTECYAWELGRNYLLFTAGMKKGQDLIITAHGSYSDIISDDIFEIPVGYTFTALGPHDWELVDPGLTALQSRSLIPYASISRNHYHFRNVNRIYPEIFNYTQNLMSVSGTTKPGYFRNYTLSKFEFDAISNYSSTRAFIELNQTCAQPDYHTRFLSSRTMDVITVRNRLLSRDTSLKNIINILTKKGIKYERIILSFCRGRVHYPLMNSNENIYDPIT